MTWTEAFPQQLNAAAFVEDSYLVRGQGDKEGNEELNTMMNAYKRYLAGRFFKGKAGNASFRQCGTGSDMRSTGCAPACQCLLETAQVAKGELTNGTRALLLHPRPQFLPPCPCLSGWFFIQLFSEMS